MNFIRANDKVKVVHDTKDLQSDKFVGVLVSRPATEGDTWVIRNDTTLREYMKFGYIEKISA